MTSTAKELLLPEPGLPQTSARDLVFLLCKWKWSITVIFTMTMLCTLVWLFVFRDDMYTSEAKVLVKLGQEQAAPTTVVGQQPMVIGYRSADVNSEVEILTSGQIMGEVVDRLGLDKPMPQPVPQGTLRRIKYEVKHAVQWVRDWKDEMLIQIGLRDRLSQREKAVAMLQKGLQVLPAKESNVILARLTLPFRKNGSVVLNAVLDDYQKFRRDLFQDAGNEVFGGMVKDHGSELSQAEAQLQDFETTNQISNQPKQKEILLEQIASAERLRNEADIDYREAQAKVDRLTAELGKPDPNLASLGGFDALPFQRGLLADLADLEKKRQELRLTELDTGDRIQNNRAQFQSVAAMLSANLQSVLADKKANFEARQRELSSLQANLKGLHDTEMRWNNLRRRVQTFEQDYLFYRKKLEESTATKSALAHDRTSNVSIIQHAMDPLQPTGVRKTTIMGLAIVVALFAALAYMAIAEFFDHSIYTRAQLERHLKVQVMAVAPWIKHHKVAPPALPPGAATTLKFLVAKEGS